MCNTDFVNLGSPAINPILDEENYFNEYKWHKQNKEKSIYYQPLQNTQQN
mgnify:CR=1 FL=1